MFIGHFGVALAAKRVDRNISLGLLLFAAVFADILFFALVLAGVERMSIVPGITAASPFDFTYYPYSHSLIASLFWAGLFFVIIKIAAHRYNSLKNRVAPVMGALVLSHFFLDVIAHRADLPLLPGDSYKIGLGLWNYFLASYLIEVLIVFIGLWIYLKSTKGLTFGGRYGMIIFSIFLLVLFTASMMAPPPSDIIGFAIFALVYQLLTVLVAAWLDRKRV